LLLRLEELSISRGDDWRYDKTNANGTFSFVVLNSDKEEEKNRGDDGSPSKGVVSFYFKYCRDDGVNFMVSISGGPNKASKTLADCSSASSSFPFDLFQQTPLVESSELLEFLLASGLLVPQLPPPLQQTDTKTESANDQKCTFAECMSWLFNVVIAESLGDRALQLPRDCVAEQLAALLSGEET